MDMDKFFRLMETWYNNNPIYCFNHRDLWEFFEFQFKMMGLYQTTPVNDYQKEIYIIGCMEDLNKKLSYIEDESDSDMIIPVYKWTVYSGRATYDMTYRFPSQDPVEIWGEDWKDELRKRNK